jgi:hypothetical protein
LQVLRTDLIVAAMVTGESDIIEFVRNICQADLSRYFGFCGNLALLQQAPVRPEDVPTGLKTAAWLANLELLEFWLTRGTDLKDLVQICYGAAAAGHGGILEVTLQVLDRLQLLDVDVVHRIMSVAYYFDNYHCLRICIPYDRTKVLIEYHVMTLNNYTYYGNTRIPEPIEETAAFQRWYESLHKT